MKYFITGATGFIGSNLALTLAEKGHQVKALVRDKARAARLKHDHIELVYGSLDNKNILEEAMDGVDGVFHLAAYAKPWAKDPTLYNKINLVGTHHVVEAAKAKQVNKIVFTSTAGTIGPSSEAPLNENSLRGFDFFNEYESTKFMAEKYLKDYVLQGMNICIVHPSRVYGPGLLSKSNAVTVMVRDFLRGRWRIIPGNGKRVGNYVYIDDVVEGHIAAMEKGKPGEQYILGGENVSYLTFFTTIRSLSGKSFRLIKVPVGLLIAISFLQMQLARMVNRPPLIPPKWVKKYLYDWALDSRKAQEELDYKITPINTGLLHTIHWLENHENHG